MIRSSPILNCINYIHERYSNISNGQVATYIPELAKANPDFFGICITTPDGQTYEVGESQHSFTIQSISKPFVYGLALADHGVDKVMSKVGVEPTGEAFNSIIFDEVYNRPYNPMVNAGAIATTALIKGNGYEQRFKRILTMFEEFAGRSLSIDEEVFQSEKSTGHRNRAIAYLELNAGMLEGNLDEHLDLYFRQCSILVTAKDLAIMAATLANNGINPITQQKVVNPKEVRAILSVMASCGMYDFSGEWMYRIGLPAKSGVGGGIIAVLPGQFGIGTFSPPLDERGNSVRGIKVCEELSQQFKFHLFDSHPVSQTCVSRTYTGAMVSSKRQRRVFQRDFLDQESEKILVYELKGDLYFATLEKLTRQLQNHQPTPQFIILDGHRVGNVNSSAITLLSEIKEWCLNQEIILFLTGFEDKIKVSLQANDWQNEMFINNVDAALEWCENHLLSEGNQQNITVTDQLLLEDMDIFKAFTTEEMAAITPLFTEVFYQPDDFIVCEGEEAKRLFLLAKGRATVSLKLPQSEERKRLTTYIPGIAFGELALFDIDISQRTADIMADTEVVCYVLEFARLKTLLNTHPEVYIKLLQTFGKSLVNTIKRATLEIRSLSV
ncbi:glutaminase A [Crocosphaera sp.]|uniref:glutaminase A n=1 Tax=Crocosphaera sp. TaxID=2729996 RepID=UPI00262DE125|nr:glutaminase A [Crocosphaera sp.]MDJ0581293.1 glutaminase A [Crocosphaera sp.]